MAAGKSTIAAALFLAALFHFSAAATTHVVGGGTGWTVPAGGAQFYADWARGQNFTVGDSLLFNFVTSVHNVAEVSQAEFDACTASNPIRPVINNGPATVTLNSPGTHHFICAVPMHCTLGQKLSIVVQASGSGSPSTPTPGAQAPTGGSAAPPPTTGRDSPSSASTLRVGFAATALFSLILFFF